MDAARHGRVPMTRDLCDFLDRSSDVVEIGTPTSVGACSSRAVGAHGTPPMLMPRPGCAGTVSSADQPHASDIDTGGVVALATVGLADRDGRGSRRGHRRRYLAMSRVIAPVSRKPGPGRRKVARWSESSCRPISPHRLGCLHGRPVPPRDCRRAKKGGKGLQQYCIRRRL